MKHIFKTKKKATYFEGKFLLRDNSNTNWAHPIDFPTVFTAHGAAIRSRNWQSCTSINTPDYVIEHYFDNKVNIYGLSKMWELCKKLSVLTWADVEKDKNSVLDIVNLANNELLKLELLP